MVGNAALWAILCVLVVLILVLAAVLLASGRQKDGLTAAAAAAVGGGLALSWGGRARRREPFYGGRDLDLDNVNILAGAGALGFPADQQAPVDVQAEHHALRTDVRNGLAAYIVTRGAPFSAVPAPGVPADAPAAGWLATDPDAVIIKDSLSLMCDAMRGEFGGMPARPNGPWRNPTWPGPNTSRWGVWQQAKANLVAALGRLCPQLVTATPADMPAKAPLDNAALLAAALHDPNIVIPAAPSPATLVAVTPATHPKAGGGGGGGGGNALVRLHNWLARALATYGNANLAVGPDLRAGQPAAAVGGPAAGPYIAVLDADQRATDAIASFNRLAPFYAAGPVAFADIAGARAEIVTLRNALRTWALVINEGTAPAVPLAAEYTALADNNIGGVNLAVHGPPNSVRWAAENLAAPPAQVWPARLAGSVAAAVGAGANMVNQPPAIGNLVVAANARLDDLLAGYNACSAAYELDWDTIGPLERNVEQAFADLLATYNAAPTVARARQSIVDKANIFVAVDALRASLNLDVAFQAALRSGAPTNARAVALWAIVARRRARLRVPNREIAALLPGATAVPVPPLPAESANIALLIDPRNYDRTIVDVGYKCRDLLAAVFRRSAMGAPPAWSGIRRQTRDLRRAWRLDPAAPELAQVERDAEQMATACFSFANTGNLAYIPAADGARAALTLSLAAINAAVLGEALLGDAVDPPNNAARKVDFTACVARAQAALAAIPPLKPLPTGVARSVGPTNRPPLPDSLRLIHYEQPPTETIGIVHDVSEIPAGTRSDVVIEAQSAEALDAMVARLPESGPRLVYGLVVDRPGDHVALYKAVAICLKMRPPPAVEKQVASRKNAATGWLYDIVRFESGAYYSRLREYIKPELYAVDV